jgi:hypothetical protein
MGHPFIAPSGAKARSILLTLRGAEAPLFHGGARIRFFLTSSEGETRRPAGRPRYRKEFASEWGLGPSL